MSSPGGEEIGRLSLRVLPDSSGFRRALQRDLDAAEAGLEVEIPVSFSVDTAGLRSQIAALNLSSITIPVDLDLQTASFRTQLAALGNSRITIPVQLDLQNIVQTLAALQQLQSRRIRLDVQVTGAAQALAELRAIDTIVSRLDGRTVNIRLDVDGLAAALAQLTALSALLAAMPSGSGSLLGSLGSVRGALGGAASMALSLATGLAKASAIATALAIAGAAITAAWGAASAAVAVLPAGIALVGVPLGLLMLDFDELKKRIGALSPAFQKFRKDASAALAEGLAPALETLATGVLPKIRDNLLGVASTMGEVARSTADWLASEPGVTAINNVLTNVNRTIKDMQPGLGDIGNAFLQLAGQSSAFDVLTQAVNGFGESFRANVEGLIGSGVMERAFKGLGTTLELAARGFSDFVTNGVELFAAAAPGVNSALQAITDLFNRVDWTSLGSSVGGVFKGLGDTIRGIPTGTLREIEDAFAKLSTKFQDPAIQQMFQNIIQLAPLAISAMGGLVETFGRIGSALSGLAYIVDGTLKGISIGFQAMGDIPGLLAGKYAKGFAEAQIQVARGGKMLGDAFASTATDLTVEVNGIPEKVLAPLRTIPGAINTLNPGIAAAVTSLGGRSTAAAERAMQGTAAGISAPLQPVPEQVASTLAPAEAAAQTATGNISNVLQTNSAQWGPAVSTGLQGVTTALQTDTAGWSTTIGTAVTGMTTTLGTGFTNLRTTATVGVTAIGVAIQTGATGWALAASLAMEGVTTAVTTGFTNIRTAATLGVTSVGVAIQTGVTGWALAVGLGMEAVSTAVTTGFETIRTAATLGVTAVGVAIQTGTTGWALAVDLGMAGVVAAVRAGMAAVTAALVVNWGAATAATTAAMATSTAVVRTGMAQMTAAVQQGAAQMTAAATDGATQITNQITLGMNQSRTAVVSGVAAMVNTLRGAVGQFRAAGAALGQGLVDGLNSKLGAVQAAARRLADAAAAATRAAAGIRSPSRVFAQIGVYMGEGMELGLHDARTGIIAEARSIVDGLNAEFGKTDTSAVHSALDDFGSDVHARAITELSDTSGAGVVGEKQVVINTNVYNPIAERGSDSVAQVHRRQAAMGIFG